MDKQTYKFSNSSTDFYFDGSISELKDIVDIKHTIVITDENVFKAHTAKFKPFKTIVIPAGEKNKIQKTVDSIILQMIGFEADRRSFIVGVGGGVVTDITGYVASIYMRGIRFGFVPTSLLGLVDASIGGKNGIDVGVYKNIVGFTKQPSFILHDLTFLTTLPEVQWQNGFAEIIKHACIQDADLFKELQSHDLKFYMTNKEETSALIQRNAQIKLNVVQHDEFEKAERRLLNFGHTLGHALENQYKLMHGQAVSIGMVYAGHISEKQLRFKQNPLIKEVLEKYGLPTQFEFDKKKVFDIVKLDKKRDRKEMNYILLNKIGKATIETISLAQLEKFIGSL